ncbi:hypothetical protein [Microcoleus asticus]|nr:hypothetical protein [Microcoleus asticus]
MTVDPEDEIAVYLEAIYANGSIKSFTLFKFPDFDGDESEAEKMALFTAAENASQKFGIRILTRKTGETTYREKAELIMVNRGRKDYLDLLNPYMTKQQLRILEQNDEIAVQLVDYGNGLLKTGDFLELEFAIRIESEKKNNEIEELRQQVSTLQLAIEGRLTSLTAGTFLGRDATTGVVQALPQSRFATPAQIDQAIIDWVGTAPANLDTLKEFGNAINNDANFFATINNALATKVNKTSDETINGFKTFASAIKTPYFEKDIVLKLTTGVNWTANTWYTIPGLIIPYAWQEVRLYELIVNYQYNDGVNSYSHWQMGGNTRLSGGIGWKAGGVVVEDTIILQQHNGSDTNILTFRSLIGNLNRGLEVKPSFNIIISGLGFIEFALKRFI